MRNKNLGLFVLVLTVFCFVGFNVYAAEEDGKDDPKLSEMCIKWKKEKVSLLRDSYGISVKYIPENTTNCAALENCNQNAKKFEISMTKKTNPDNSSYVFKLSAIKLVDTDDQLLDSGIKHTYSGDELVNAFGLNDTNNRLSLTNSLFINNPANSFTRFRFVLVPVNFQNEDFIKNCGKDGVMEIEADFDYFGEPFYSNEQSSAQMLQPSIGSTGKIDCNVTYDSQKNNFEFNFCNDRAAAIAYANATKQEFPIEFKTEYSTYAKLAAAKKLSPTVKYFCDPFGPLDKTKDSADYYVNKSYLWGTIDYIVTGGPYVYNYGGQNENGIGNNPKKESVSCTVRCDEVVTTEYGAPVASKAGLCFEYKVKVTSRVNCFVVKKPDPPKTEQGYCTPAPGCNHGNGYVDTAAGPVEEFEACIERCDGGKYTDKCSKKCYKEAYGNTNSSKTSLEIGYANRGTPTLLGNTVPRVEGNTCKDPLYGRYDYYPNRGIIWAPENMLGRWYCKYINSYRRYPCVKSDAEGGGIASVCGCGAECMWVGCGGNTYLNPGESARDDTKNIEIYNQVLRKCESYSKCSTTQAEFSINVSYTHGKSNSKQTVYFPYTQNNDKNTKDTIKYTRETASVACTSVLPNTTIILSNGCYTCADSNSTNDTTGSSNNWYQTEWSFPGTWIHNKTGEISYVPVTQPGWVKYKRKYCIPLDANNVNQKWWNAYYVNRYKDLHNLSYFVPSYSKCEVTSCDTTFTQEDANNLDHNINAHTRKFGLLEWDIDISCFYALNKNFPKHESGLSCTVKDTKCLDSEASYNIRPVELSNLFPAEDGSTLSTSTTTGRTPGFNWSVYATNILKDQDYTSRPGNYVKWVQKKGYNVYSDDYLDYEFDLTKDVINKIKKAKDNYTAFTGEAAMNSVVNYRSSLFRGGNAIIHSDKIPSTTALKCNNMKNYRSDECDDFAEDGE